MSDDGTNTSGTEVEVDPNIGNGGTTDPGPATEPDNSSDQAPVSDPNVQDATEPTTESPPDPTEPAVTLQPPDPASVAHRQTIETMIEEWRNDELRGSVVARSTEIWNYLDGAIGKLVDKIHQWTRPAS